MRRGQHRRRADEAEIPADPEKDESAEEVRQLHARKRHGTGTGEAEEARGHDPLHPETADQVAREERGRIHREDVGGDDIGGTGRREAAADDGERRCRHHQVHQRVADGPDEDRHGDPGAREQLAAGPAPRAAFGFGCRAGDVEEEEEPCARDVQRRSGEVGA